MDTQSSQRRTELAEYQFRCSVGQISVLANLLKSVSFTPKVNIVATSRGLRFIVEEGKYIQASVTIYREIFEEFNIVAETDDSEISFQIPFKELLDCLKYFCTDVHGRSDTFALTTAASIVHSSNKITSLKLLYKSFGYPLQLLLDENGVTTDFEVKTEPFDEDLIDFDIGATITCKIIVVSEHMSDVLAEFDSNNPGTIRVSIIPAEKIVLTCEGVSGVMTASIPANTEMVQLFESTSELHISYNFSMLRHTFRAMNMSHTMSIKIDSNGVLRLIFLTKSDCFVEFFCLPSAVDEGDVHGGLG